MKKNSKSSLLSYWLFIPLFLVFMYCSCSKKQASDTKAYTSDSLFKVFETQYKKSGNRNEVLSRVDSLYNTLPEFTTQDHYRYLNFKSKIIKDLPADKSSSDTAFYYCDSVVKLFEQTGLKNVLQKEYVQAYIDRANFYYDQYKLDSSMSDFYKSIQIAKQYGNNCDAIKGGEGQARVAIRQSKLPYAAETLKEALRMLQDCPRNNDFFYYQQRFLDDLGSVYNRLKLYDSAVYFHQQAIDFIKQNKQLSNVDTLFPYRALSNCYTNIGLAYFNAGKMKEGAETSRKGVEYAEKIPNDPVAVASAKIPYIFLLAEIEKPQKVQKYLKDLWGEMQKLGALEQIYFLYRAIHYTKKHNLKEDWMNYSLRYYPLKDSMQSAELVLQQKDPVALMEKKDKRYQVELLQKDARIRQSRMNAAFIIGGLLLLIIGGFVYAIYRIRLIMKKRTILYNKLQKREAELEDALEQLAIQEKQKREQELYYQEVQLQLQYSEEIVNQRRKISEDLHDDLSSSLAALRYYVDDLYEKSGSETEKNTLQSVKEEVSTIYINARQYMHSLRSSSMNSRLDIVLFLEEMKRKFEEKTSLVFTLNIDKSGVSERLNYYQNDHLYYTFNEAITNILKHAGATAIHIEIKIADNECRFVISDNGRGFSPGIVSDKGLGLKSMQKRMAELDGKLSISSNETGTRVEGCFPLDM